MSKGNDINSFSSDSSSKEGSKVVQIIPHGHFRRIPSKAECAYEDIIMCIAGAIITPCLKCGEAIAIMKDSDAQIIEQVEDDKNTEIQTSYVKKNIKEDKSDDSLLPKANDFVKQEVVHPLPYNEEGTEVIKKEEIEEKEENEEERFSKMIEKNKSEIKEKEERKYLNERIIYEDHALDEYVPLYFASDIIEENNENTSEVTKRLNSENQLRENNYLAAGCLGASIAVGVSTVAGIMCLATIIGVGMIANETYKRIFSKAKK